MIKNKRIFITGGAGFIGSEISERLSKDNKIYIYDNFARNAIQYTSLTNNKNVHIEDGDVLDIVHLGNSVIEFQPQIVLHLAAIAGASNVTRNPVNTMEVNIIGTYNILKSLLPIKDSLERIIDISTSEIFGKYAYDVSENSNSNIPAVGENRWTYNTSKLASEYLTHSYCVQYGYPTVTLRPFNIYGPGQVGEGAVHLFIKKALNNEVIQIHGDGSQIRAWCHVYDFVDALMLSLEKDEAVGNAFNIGNPRGTVTISMLVDFIIDITKSNSKVEYISKNYVDVELRVPSIKKAQKVLGYNPKYDLREGLENTAEWYKKLYCKL